MAVNNRLTSFELGNKIKSLMDNNKTNQEIIYETNIGQSQLTNYKRVIVLGKLDELNQGKPLNDIVKENKGIKIKKEQKTREQTISEDIDRNLAKKVKKEQDRIHLNKVMRERIEYIESLGFEATKYEYFQNGKWKIYIPFPPGPHNFNSERESMLRLQNTILRDELRDNLQMFEDTYRLRLRRVKKDLDIQKSRNNELNAQLNTLIFTEQRTVEESIVGLQKEIADLKRQLEESKKINEKEVLELVEKDTKAYQNLLDQRDLEVKLLKEMFQKCEDERRTAVHKNTKKYLASMADHWEKQYNSERETNKALSDRIEELEAKLKE